MLNKLLKDLNIDKEEWKTHNRTIRRILIIDWWYKNHRIDYEDKMIIQLINFLNMYELENGKKYTINTQLKEAKKKCLHQ